MGIVYKDCFIDIKMVQHCVVPLCMNTTKNPGISFFSFPRDKKVRKSWIIKIRRDDQKCAKVSDTMRVCSAHFEEESFVLSTNGKRRCLRKDAIPTIFKFTSTKVKTRRTITKYEPKASSSSTIEVAPELLDSVEPEQDPIEDGLIETPELSLESMIEKLTTAENRNKELENRNKELENRNKDLEDRINDLTIQLEGCLKENGGLKKSLEEIEGHKCTTFSLDTIEKDAQLLTYYTGFDDVKMLYAFLEYVNPNYLHQGVSFSHKLSYKDQILVVLSKLRQGFDNIDLAHRIGVSPKHISKVFVNWINRMYFRLSYLNIWPHRNIILDKSPSSFKLKYPDTVLLLDCTELKIECPSDLVLQSQSYSSYKSHNTMKGLIGCDPNGGLLFVSSLFTGSISDKKIVEMSGLYKLLAEKLKAEELLPNDSVMFDKGFNISNEIMSLGLNYNVPPMATECQFTEGDVIKTRTIASCRVHVERLIRRIKSFKILSNVLPITMMPHLNQVWTVCCILTGFRTVTKT